MDPQPPSTDPLPPSGLPPVAPPSGRFIVQLFLVPGLIVLIAVLLLLAFRGLVGGSHTPESFLRQLDSDNDDIRWRGASDLAQVLKRPEAMHLKTDPVFALDLAQRLRQAFQDLDQAEKEIDRKVMELPLKEREKLRPWVRLRNRQTQVRFLTAALGDFLVPVGLPLLGEVALYDGSPDLKGNTLRRRQALWSIANLGANVRTFPTLDAEKREKVIDKLVAEAEGNHPQRSAWAALALSYLDPAKVPTSVSLEGSLRADQILAKAAQAPDRYLREQTALALSFWDGPLVEPTLLSLTRDDGHGTLVRVEENE